MKYVIEGLDALGKDTLIDGILHQHGYHQVIHYSKPVLLDAYKVSESEASEMTATEIKTSALMEYQFASFQTMFAMLQAPGLDLILNRAHLGECVYAPLYRGYDGDYVFLMEKLMEMDLCEDVRLILLTENFSVSKHFVDDGESFDVSMREKEQNMFIEAFNKSCIKDKRQVNVTASTGHYRPKKEILDEVLS